MRWNIERVTERIVILHFGSLLRGRIPPQSMVFPKPSYTTLYPAFGNYSANSTCPYFCASSKTNIREMKRTTTARSPFIEIPLFGKCLEVFSGGVLGDGHTLSYLSDLPLQSLPVIEVSDCLNHLLHSVLMGNPRVNGSETLLGLYPLRKCRRVDVHSCPFSPCSSVRPNRIAAWRTLFWISASIARFPKGP